MQIQIRLLLKKQSDKGLPCVLFWQAFCPDYRHFIWEQKEKSVWKFRAFTICMYTIMLWRVHAGIVSVTKHKDTTHRVGGNRKHYQQSTNTDQKSIDCHLSPVWRQMAIENSVSNNFLSTFLDSIGGFHCRLPGVYNVFEILSYIDVCSLVYLVWYVWQEHKPGCTVMVMSVNWTVAYYLFHLWRAK